MSSSESAKQASSKPMRSASSRKTSTFDFVSPGAGQRRTRELQMVMPVGEIKIGVFQERCGRQQNVGVIRGVVLKLLQHHGEQILAPHPLQHQVLIGSDGRRIGVVHHHRLHRRIVQFRQRLAQLRHVDDARLASERRSPLQFRHFQARAIHLKRLAGGELQSAAHFAPRSNQRRQRRNRPRRRSTALAALDSIVEPDGGRPRGRVFARQRNDVFARQCP